MRDEKKNDEIRFMNQLKDQQSFLLNQELEQKSLINEMSAHSGSTQKVRDLQNQLKEAEEKNMEVIKCFKNFKCLFVVF